MTQQSTERAGRDRSTLALDGDAIGREAARLGPPRAQRPPGRAHGVYCRHGQCSLFVRPSPRPVR